jgi:hypothetical protein
MQLYAYTYMCYSNCRGGASMGRLILVFALSVLFLTSLGLARTWYITDDGTGDAPTIQAGIDSSAAGDEVVLADGVYTGPGNRDVYIASGRLVRSENGDPSLCVIDCQGSESEPHRGFSMGATGATLEGVKVVNGYIVGDGGGAIYTSGRAVIHNCIFENNYASEGGALFAWDYHFEPPGIVVSNCQFLENESYTYGSAVVCFDDETNVSFDYCTFAGNSAAASWAGVVDLWGSSDPITSLSMSNCTVVGNSSGIAGVTDISQVVENTIIAYNGWDAYGCQFSCSNIYGNDGGDWGDVPGQPGQNGNISACPSFCAAGDYRLCDESPCAPGNHPDSVDCGLIGAWDVGCACGPSATESSSWSAIKSIYR